MIDPDSKAVKYFYLFLLMALLYNAWMIPFRIAFLQAVSYTHLTLPTKA